MGAWIETVKLILTVTVSVPSLPIWERGLNPFLNGENRRDAMSLPIWERGLKPR